MHYRVIVAAQADADLEKILDYVELEFGRKAALKFTEVIDTFLLNLELWPEVHPMYYSEMNIRRAVVHKRVVIFYEVIH